MEIKTGSFAKVTAAGALIACALITALPLSAESWRGEQTKLGFGVQGGYFQANKLLPDSWAIMGGGTFLVKYWFEPAGFTISANYYSGGGSAGADLEAMVRLFNFYESPGKAFNLYGGIGFGVHAVPGTFDDGFQLTGLTGGVSGALGFERSISDEVNLWFQTEYGILGGSGTPNFFDATLGVIIYGR